MLVFGFAWWLGLYLVGRNPARALLVRAGLGMAIYALALAAALLQSRAPYPGLAIVAGRAYTALLFLPALCWAGALIQVLPDQHAWRDQLDRWWRRGLAPLVLLLGLLVAFGDLVFRNGVSGGWPYFLIATLVHGPLLAGLVLVLRAALAERPRNALGLAIAATLFFTLGLALVVFPLGLLPPLWGLLAIGLDLLLFDLAVVALDAFDEGETLWPDIVRSFLGAAFAALLFGSQVALVMLNAGASFVLLALLLAVVAAAIALQTFADPIQAALDRLAFAQAPHLRRERAGLRAAASALPRLDAERPLAEIDAAEFARLVRRALSHYGDLPRLASSPLTHLPIVDARLRAHAAPDHPLERAAALKALLAESIARLKPHGAAPFGTTDEWRHYNALFFPYVVGLRPYSRRAMNDGLDPAAQAALDWLAANVPERTLYNWQNAAARLIAHDLRAQIGASEAHSTTLSAKSG